MFQQPSQGDQFNVSEHVGSLVLIWAREYRDEIQTMHGPTDAIAAGVHVLDGPKGGETYENTLIFGSVLISSLRSAVGGDPVLGRVGQGLSKPGKNPPWVLNPFTEADAAVATSYIQRMPKPFQAPANGGPTTTAPGATPAPAATATAPTAPANGTPAVDYSTLPPEVQELLRKSGAMA